MSEFLSQLFGKQGRKLRGIGRGDRARVDPRGARRSADQNEGDDEVFAHAAAVKLAAGVAPRLPRPPEPVDRNVSNDQERHAHLPAGDEFEGSNPALQAA
jgi:hypothetical protein